MTSCDGNPAGKENSFSKWNLQKDLNEDVNILVRSAAYHVGGDESQMGVL